ncbi:hypothetical protein IFM89_031324 [Coptis chinensis]|uniref:Uncharacterized protein n=1 Tax=Coptis chinensis TaxID=261450 RepID=A0A835MDZ6_9MAGN|nr:hypothetical protein IFM89_031324 [Coptis chinensis]
MDLYLAFSPPALCKEFNLILGLDVCADTLVGNDMLRGISGGQMKRVTIGEMLAGAAKALFMDEISIDGQIVYQGPRENVLEFFGLMGFQCPDRKGVADFFAKLGDLKERSETVLAYHNGIQHIDTLTVYRNVL